jgi:hypothetical protein
VAFARIGWVATAAADMRHSRMRTQMRQVAVLGRAHTKSRAEHIGVCAVARGIHRSFRSAIRLRTEGARSAGVDTHHNQRDARKACRLRATRRRLRATLVWRQGAPRDVKAGGRPDGRSKKLFYSPTVLIVSDPRLARNDPSPSGQSKSTVFLIAFVFLRFGDVFACFRPVWASFGLKYFFIQSAFGFSDPRRPK